MKYNEIRGRQHCSIAHSASRLHANMADGNISCIATSHMAIVSHGICLVEPRWAWPKGRQPELVYLWLERL